jgi:hypothetical protein
VQQLQTRKTTAIIQYCCWVRSFGREGFYLLDNLFYTGEARLHLSGYIYRPNSRIWSAENPYEMHEDALHSSNYGVGCEVPRKQIVGPYFFEETVTAEIYRNF